MNILIAGASGFIGQELISVLKDQNDITVLGRDLEKLKGIFSADIILHTWDELNELNAKSYDVLINLSGANISSNRWTTEFKNQIIDSRVETTLSLINWAKSQKATPRFYCANAVGIYGLQANGDKEVFTEDSHIEVENPRDFMSEIGVKWQKAAEKAVDSGMDLTITRFGVVLKKGQGMLKKLAPAYYLGLGSVIGDGEQYISWIHIDDLVQAYAFLLNHPELTGAYNLTSPHPVEQKRFAKSLASAMNRPLFLKTPAKVIQWMFGEMGDCLINHGQQVAAKKILEAGFVFKYPNIDLALKQEFQ